ncbi:MAG TPA: 3-dehydroquinate synthase, partial [Actinomycetota bacterium]|nr:3-dehydroquinate synthase [Actinomycetota bacterium]
MTVAVAQRAYDVSIGPGLLSRVGELVPSLPAAAERAFVVADARVAEGYLAPLERGLQGLGVSVVHLGVP